MTIDIDKLLQSTLTTEYKVKRSKLEHYIASALCPISDAQRKRLNRVQVVPAESGLREIGSPADLFETDLDFPSYVDSRIEWARSTGGTAMVQRTKAINAICKFHTPRFGWLDYKEEHESKRDTGTNRREETEDGDSRSNDLAAAGDSTEAYRRYLAQLEETRS